MVILERVASWDERDTLKERMDANTAAKESNSQWSCMGVNLECYAAGICAKYPYSRSDGVRAHMRVALGGLLLPGYRGQKM